MTVATPRSTFIFCPNGHLVAIANRDLHRGERFYTDGFTFLNRADQPQKGDIPACYCGADWWNPKDYYNWVYEEKQE
jgi:hypothetical protein